MTYRTELVLFLIAYLIILNSLGIRSQNVESPCPSIFRYQYDNQNGLYGEIQIIVPTSTNKVILNLEMSIGNAVQGYNGKIEVINPKATAINISNGRPLVYYVYFPSWQNIPPKITQIVVNGNLICTGPKVPMNSVPFITTVNLQHTLRINISPLSSSNIAPENNLIPVNNYPAGEPPDASFHFYEIDQYGNTKRPTYTDKNKFNFNPTLPPNQFNFQPKPQQQPVTESPSDVYKGNPFFTNDNIYNTGNNGQKPNTGSIIHTPRPTAAPLRPTQNIPAIATHTEPPRPSEQPIDFLDDIELASKDSVQPVRPYEDVCGQSLTTNHLIFNGKLVPRGAYPWLVAVFQVKTTGVNYICSGSLISTKHIVTAAHCVEIDHRKLRPQEVLLILGKLNIHKWIPVRGEKIVEPESIHIHPDYESLTSDADIAVLTLGESLQITNYIRPVCLWRGDTDLDFVVGHSGTIVGWGKDENGVLMTEEPKQTDLPIVSQEKCLASNLQFHYITSNRTFCAGFRNNTGPCNGDSGGGFVMKWDGRWMLRGIVSLSISETNTKSCDLSNYVVFTDASKFLNWLRSFLK
ncbi:serine protease gd-like [Diabrotica undecimpunctata]|uniref:serine protease gd-like n=1 Tax=Diabrotica undecimpunctata TaxID=50387 RepID=UPI003B6410C8